MKCEFILPHDWFHLVLRNNFHQTPLSWIFREKSTMWTCNRCNRVIRAGDCVCTSFESRQFLSLTHFHAFHPPEISLKVEIFFLLFFPSSTIPSLPVAVWLCQTLHWGNLLDFSTRKISVIFSKWKFKWVRLCWFSRFLVK